MTTTTRKNELARRVELNSIQLLADVAFANPRIMSQLAAKISSESFLDDFRSEIPQRLEIGPRGREERSRRGFQTIHGTYGEVILRG